MPSIRLRYRLILLTAIATAIFVGLGFLLQVIFQFEPKKHYGEANSLKASPTKTNLSLVRDPIERTIIEQIYASGPGGTDENHDRFILSYLSEHPRLNYVIYRAFPARIDRKQDSHFQWEEIPSPVQQGHFIECGFDMYCPKGFQRRVARIVEGEWSINLDKSLFKSAVISRLAQEREEARRNNYMFSTIPASLLRITNKDPLLESYCFSIMVPMEWKIPKETVIDLDAASHL